MNDYNKILQIYKKHLINSKNQLEGQRIKEKYFKKYSIDFSLFKKYSISNAQTLYNYINKTNDTCITENCQNKRRFISFKHGYKDYCSQCSRKIHQKHLITYKDCEIIPDINFEKREKLKDILQNTIINNKIQTNELLKLTDNIIHDIYNTTYYLTSKKFNERIYHILNDLFEPQICVDCGRTLTNFISSKEGYYSTRCTNGCAKSYSEKHKSHSKIKIRAYNKWINKFYNYKPQEYDVKVFSLEDYIGSKFECEVTFVHKKCGHTYKRNIMYQGSLHCPKCYAIRSKQQYLIHDFIWKYYGIESSFNDRKLLDGKELDLYFSDYKFAIEYDGQKYHSFGPSKSKVFNNIIEDPKGHLYKTKLCENKNIQLFRIFSSEWLNPTKQQIWKSMISNKLGKSDKIFARKCIIKEISSHETKTFLENNHLQGNINASIRIGLFYNKKLVQIMTFRVPTQTKYKGVNNYELSRLCGLINTSVIGGASKLLKYFERTYKPNMIISYANRRWSYNQSNVYSNLGFEYKGSSAPNFFYIKGNDFDSNKLESRQKFQKYKLAKILDYDNKLSAEENIYNNNYRKIYDCGNNVYVKEYK
jgi:hypothetical protein